MPTINNPYNQQPPQMGQPMGEMFPPDPGMMPQRKKTWRERRLGGNSGKELTLRQELTIPNWIVGSSVAVFFVAMVLCWLAWGHPMETRYAIIASLSVVLFFFGSKSGSRNWVRVSEKRFIKNVFLFGLFARLTWSMYCYFFFNPDCYGNTFGDTADTIWYMSFGADIANWIKGDSSRTFLEIVDVNGSAIDDIGYPTWIALIELITFGYSDVFVPFIIKGIVGAYCAKSIYYVAKRHFGEGAARMAALFVALNPNMIFWCGNMYKEVEMMFLCCLCVDLVDRTFTSGAKLTFKSLLPGISAGFSLFFFRAALGTVLFLAMLAHVVMASNKVMSLGKKVVAGVLVALTLSVGMGDRLLSQTEKMVDIAQSDSQEKTMKWNSQRKEESGAQQNFAKYASAAVFAPLIFTIPFPTFTISNEMQIIQPNVSGGNFIKNIFSFFVIYVMLVMLLTGDWRRHVFILAYTCGYLMCLVLSSFAHSSRFHMPIWPMLMLFAAYGIQVAKTNKRVRKWWPMVLVAEVLICLAWNWFKLAGRGMV